MSTMSAARNLHRQHNTHIKLVPSKGDAAPTKVRVRNSGYVPFRKWVRSEVGQRFCPNGSGKLARILGGGQ